MLRKLLPLLLAALAVCAAADSQVVISDRGSIPQMTLPAGWSKGEERRAGPGLLRIFDSPEGEQVHIRYYRTLYTYAPAGGVPIRRIFDSPLQVLARVRRSRQSRHTFHSISVTASDSIRNRPARKC